MGDTELRAHERRFREIGEVADEAAWIVARVRAGKLAPAQVAVAGLCGHDGALASGVGREPTTLDGCAAVFGVRPATVRRWVKQGCPATRADGVVELDVAAVVRWQQAWAPRKRHDAFMRALARVDPVAAECFRPFMGAPRDALRKNLASWALGVSPEGGWEECLLEPLRRDPQAAVTEWLVRQLELRHGGADHEQKVAGAAYCLLRRDQPVEGSRLLAIPSPRHDAVERLIRFLARICECALGFKEQSVRRMQRLHGEGKVELLEERETIWRQTPCDVDYAWTCLYRCVVCGSRWIARTEPYEDDVKPWPAGLGLPPA